jgi:hypothetical protein
MRQVIKHGLSDAWHTFMGEFRARLDSEGYGVADAFAQDFAAQLLTRHSSFCVPSADPALPHRTATVAHGTAPNGCPSGPMPCARS